MGNLSVLIGGYDEFFESLIIVFVMWVSSFVGMSECDLNGVG